MKLSNAGGLENWNMQFPFIAIAFMCSDQQNLKALCANRIVSFSIQGINTLAAYFFAFFSTHFSKASI